MEKVSNISSEEELLELRNEGKVSEQEYEELLETLRKTGRADVGPGVREKPAPAKTSGLAVASLALSLLGPLCCIPAVICGHLALRKIERDVSLRGRGVALAGIIVGYAVLGLSVVVFIPYLLLYGLRADSQQRHKSMAMAELERIRAKEARIAPVQLRSFPVDSTEGLMDQSAGELDEQISSDGNGSLRIAVTGSKTIRLYETGDIDIENARLIYQARLRTQNLQGKAYLEMWCHFPGGGEYFSKGLYAALIGSTGTNWTIEEIPFVLKKGQNPDNVKLNLVIEGKGTVWIDDIRLLKASLE